MRNKLNNDEAVDFSGLIELGGINQYISVKGDNINNPLLLLLHGGPGVPAGYLTHCLPQGYEENFLFVNWDQRGTGRSYSDIIPEESMNIEQFVSDAIELIDYLLKQYNKDKLYILGTSWGSVIGTQVAKRVPENVYAYIGSGQVVDMEKQEEVSYDFLLEEVKKMRNKEAITELETIGRPPYKDFMNDVMIQRKWLISLGFAERNTNTAKLFKENCSEEQLKLIDKGTKFSLTCLLDELRTYHINDIKQLDVPVYFFTGKYDYQTPKTLVEKYCRELNAPKKKIIWFNKSGHSPIFEEPKEFIASLVQVCNNHKN